MVQTPLFDDRLVAAGDGAEDNRLREPLVRAFEKVPPSWQSVTTRFLESAEGDGLVRFVDQRVREGAVVYPAQVFRALEFAEPDEIRVVILGQDPYHGAGQAQGLAFSVAPGRRVLPPSLRNILKEVQADFGVASICRDDLSPWARQGVLLLNTALTVEDGSPQSHAGHGWEALTDALIARVAAQAQPAVFMLWGAPAQRKRGLVDGEGASRHLVLMSNHPSPLSASRPPVPFLGCRHFSRADEFLASRRPGAPPIRW